MPSASQIHTVYGDDLCRVHVPPSGLPVDATVTVDKGQPQKRTGVLHTAADTSVLDRRTIRNVRRRDGGGMSGSTSEWPLRTTSSVR